MFLSQLSKSTVFCRALVRPEPQGLEGLDLFFFFDKLGISTYINRGIYPVQKNLGFTLIELLVVVLIIGILAAVAVPQYQRAVSKSRYVQVMTSANAVASAALVYKMANGSYPSSLEDLDITLPGTLSADKKIVSLNGYSCKLYMGEVSKDSVLCQRGTSGNQYVGYRVLFGGVRDGQRFCLAKKEDQEAASLCISLGGKEPFDNGVGLMHYRL